MNTGAVEVTGAAGVPGATTARPVEVTGVALPGFSRRAPLDTERLRREHSWDPDLSLERGLRRTLHGR